VALTLTLDDVWTVSLRLRTVLAGVHATAARLESAPSPIGFYVRSQELAVAL
jgi:hypothetical protein